MDASPRIARLIRLLALAAGIAAGGLAPAEAPNGVALRVLFIGNSLTDFNDLPQMVEAVGRASGGPKVRASSISVGGYSLGDHLESPSTFNTIDSRRWDFVVLQQGPSALPESRLLLRADVARFAEVIRGAGAEPAIYQVWPETYRPEAFPDVIESYRLAAEDVGAPLLPAGRAWQIALARDPALPLYSADGFHPSKLGSLLAAIVIYEGLTGHSTATQPWHPNKKDRRRLAATPEQLDALLDAAAQARAELGPP